MAEIGCKKCLSPDCKGCNTFILETALKQGKFDTLMDGNRTIHIAADVRCGECKYYLKSNEKCSLIDTRLHFYETDNVWTEDSYCSWGKRKKDGDGNG